MHKRPECTDHESKRAKATGQISRHAKQKKQQKMETLKCDGENRVAATYGHSEGHGAANECRKKERQLEAQWNETREHKGRQR